MSLPAPMDAIVIAPLLVILPIFTALPLLSIRVTPFVCKLPPELLILPVALTVPLTLVPVAVTARYVVEPRLFWISKRLPPIGELLSRSVSPPTELFKVISGLVELLYAVCKVALLPLLPPSQSCQTNWLPTPLCFRHWLATPVLIGKIKFRFPAESPACNVV